MSKQNVVCDVAAEHSGNLLTVSICCAVATLYDALRYGQGSELSIMNALPGTNSTSNSTANITYQQATQSEHLHTAAKNKTCHYTLQRQSNECAFNCNSDFAVTLICLTDSY